MPEILTEMKNPKHKKKTPTSILRLYEESVKKVRLEALKSKLSESVVNDVMNECLQKLLNEQSMLERAHGRSKIFSLIKKTFSHLKFLLIILFSFLVFVLILYAILQHKPTQYFLQSKLQDYIYPGMKILRKLFLPVITIFPSLTNLYDESCLVVNPFFRVPDMICPCGGVRAVLNLTGEDTKREEYHPGIPFIVKINGEEVSWWKLKELYKKYSTVFDRDATDLTISTTVSHNKKTIPASIFNSEMSKSWWNHTHIKWRCNRMEPTRFLRSIFGVPDTEPNYAAGVTIEKLVMVDGPQAPSYRMPTTDGTTVFIQQSSGSRVIVLSPAHECKEKCTTVSVELPPGHILWFSWWYWRASSLPSPATETLSVTYVGSYL